jgi:glycosyltransferase involved in cell wall biosynthesis
MKVSLITVVFNCEDFIEQCIQSVLNQDYPKLEYIVIDGNSSDCTPSIIEKYQDQVSHYISEPDGGMYDALNKGIAWASGELVGIVNADDYLAGPTVISQIVHFLTMHNADAVYGNLNYVKRHDTGIINRKWRSNALSRRDLKLGWMPAHPTLFIRKTYFQRYGGYSVKLGTAADYDLVLRFFFKHRLSAVFLDQLIVHMRTGGISNRNLKSVVSAIKYDYRVMVHNQLPFPLLALVFKKLRKLKQFT